MTNGKSWAWALPGVFLASICLAQAAPTRNATLGKQLKHVRQQVKSQKAQARDLKHQIHAIKQRNTADQASLAKRDAEIAKLKARLASKQSGSGAAPAAGKAGKHAAGH